MKRAKKKLDKSLSDLYYEFFRNQAAGEEFFSENRKLDAGLTERLARRPITSMEIDIVTKKAENRFRDMCLRERNRGTNLG